MLAKELCDLTGYDMVLPMNSGAEAVETAVKTARKWAYQKKGMPQDQAEIIACANNFHGRTVTVISFSTEPLYRKDFGPFTPGFKIIPFGDAEALEKAITPNTAAFLVEPIQAEAGILIPPDGYLKKAARSARAHNVLFIADEIQTGLGRTGKLFAFEYEGVRPDMVIIGKSLGGGCYPISARPGRPRESSASSSPASTARPSAATRWPAPWPGRALRGHQGREARRERGRARRATSWRSCARPSRAATSRRSAATGCSSASSSIPRPAAPAGSARS